MAVMPGKLCALAHREDSSRQETYPCRGKTAGLEYTYKIVVVTDEVCPVQDQGRQGELGEESHGLRRGFVARITRLAKARI